MDIPFLEDLHRAWEDCPPLDAMVAAYLGIKPKKRASQSVNELLAMFPGGQIK